MIFASLGTDPDFRLTTPRHHHRIILPPILSRQRPLRRILPTYNIKPINHQLAHRISHVLIWETREAVPQVSGVDLVVVSMLCDNGGHLNGLFSALRSRFRRGNGEALTGVSLTSNATLIVRFPSFCVIVLLIPTGASKEGDPFSLKLAIVVT